MGQQDISKTVRFIRQKAHGTASGAIIDMATGICTILDRFNHRLTKLENQQCCCKEKSGPTTKKPNAEVRAKAVALAGEKSGADSVQLPVPKVQNEVSDTPDSKKVSDPQVLKPTDKTTTRKAKKGATRKANPSTKS